MGNFRNNISNIGKGNCGNQAILYFTNLEKAFTCNQLAVFLQGQFNTVLCLLAANKVNTFQKCLVCLVGWFWFVFFF